MIDVNLALAAKIANLSGIPAEELLPHITEPPKPELGDLAVPCFVLSKKLKQDPSQIAVQLADKFSSDNLFSKSVAEGPYLNVFLHTSTVTPIINKILSEKSSYGSSSIGLGKAVVVDFSSPNIAKHLGIHHLRSTMIGHAICNLHTKCGYTTKRVNFLGDWGTQFGMLIAAFKKEHQNEEITVNYLTDLYVRFNSACEKDPSLKEEGKLWFKKLENRDDEAVKLWSLFKNISLQEFEKIYTRLSVEFDIFDGESHYSDDAQTIVQESLNKNVAIISQGAVVIEMPNKAPCILQKSDGATTYLARDVAAVVQRYKIHRFEKMLYVVGHPQAQHFEQLFYVLEKLGYTFSKKCQHISFGLLKAPKLRMDDRHHEKFSTRQGNILLLNDVLDTAATEVQTIVKEKDNNLDNHTIGQIGISAVVFADLSGKRTRDVIFSWKDILNFDGNTGPYLQYTLVRCNSIIRKSEIELFHVDEKYLSMLSLDEERWILYKLSQFDKIILEAMNACDPSILCQYLIKLARLTNRYIHDVRVIQPDLQLQTARTALIMSISIVLAESLYLIGIATLERM